MEGFPFPFYLHKCPFNPLHSFELSRLVQADGQLEIEVLCSSKPGANIRAVGGVWPATRVNTVFKQTRSAHLEAQPLCCRTSLRGSDTRQGEVVLRKGCRIGAGEIGDAWLRPLMVLGRMWGCVG